MVTIRIAIELARSERQSLAAMAVSWRGQKAVSG
jgi:hypothetical protein